MWCHENSEPSKKMKICAMIMGALALSAVMKAMMMRCLFMHAAIRHGLMKKWAGHCPKCGMHMAQEGGAASRSSELSDIRDAVRQLQQRLQALEEG